MAPVETSEKASQKAVDLFLDRLVEILLMQVEQDSETQAEVVSGSSK